jgi:hypothetical protein
MLFVDFWKINVYDSYVYKKLSTQDQALILDFTTQSAGISATVSSSGYGGFANLPYIDSNIPINPAQVVNTNSDTTIRCGQNGQC